MPAEKPKIRRFHLGFITRLYKWIFLVLIRPILFKISHFKTSTFIILTSKIALPKMANTSVTIGIEAKIFYLVYMVEKCGFEQIKNVHV
jgi:hypothetical protein